jgi:hypothetical protein
LTVYCPECLARARYDVAALPARHACRCGHEVPLDASLKSKDRVDVCAVCGLAYFYVDTNFPKRLGCATIVLAGGVFVVLSYFGYWWAPFVLVGTAALDALIYRWVGRYAICYKCLAEYRGFRPNPAHAPFDLATAQHFADER